MQSRAQRIENEEWTEILNEWGTVSSSLGTLKPVEKECLANKKKKNSERSPIPLFQSDEHMEMTLTSHYPDLKDPNGMLSYWDGEKFVKLQVTIEGRGGVRVGLCTGAPLIKLKIESAKKDTVFNKSKKELKLLTHCEGKVPTADVIEYFHKEYTIYKIMNVLDEPSFKVRYVNMTYQNWQGVTVFKAPVMFLESHEDAAARYDSQAMRKDKLIRVSVREELRAYIVGHFLDDYDHGVDHEADKNVRRIKDGNGKQTLLLYDFNESGLYNNPSGIKNKIEKHSYISSDINRFLEEDPAETKKVLKRIYSRKEQVLTQIKNSPMNVSGKERFTNYFSAYFETLEEMGLAP